MSAGRSGLLGWCCLVAAVLAPGRLAIAQEVDSVLAVRIADSVWVIEGAVDRIGVISGPDGTLLVDAGYPETASSVRAALEKIGAPSPRIIVNTHWHHAFANAEFADDAMIIGHGSLRERLSQPNWMYNREVPAFPEKAQPDITFRDSLRLNFNGYDVLLLEYANAHTESDVVAFLDDAGIVFTGDLFVPHIPWVDVETGGSPRGWLAAVDDLLRRIPLDAVIVPGHDDVSDRARLREFRDLLEEAVTLVEDGKRAGRTREEIAGAGLSSRWDAWEGVIPISRFLETVYDGLTGSGHPAQCAATRAPQPVALTNGHWWNGSSFQRDTLWMVDGWLTRKRPTRESRTIDLGGRFVIPPLADAHTHRLAYADELETDLSDHRRAGVLYAMNMDPLRVVDAALLNAVGGPCGVDVAYTEGVVTPSWSTVVDFYRTMVANGRFGSGVDLASLDGKEIHLVDDEADLEAAWPRLVARNPSFVKIILAFSDQWERRRDNPVYPAAFPRGSGKPGLDPSLVPEIVRRAHARGIRVAAHIETAADFRIAVAAGVDIVAHLPGAWQVGETAGYPNGDLEPWLLTPADARAAKEHGVVVVTTARPDPTDPRSDDFAAIHRHNVSTLMEAGVRLALGSDGAPGSTATEALYLAGLKVLSTREILNLATRETARVIFPGRRMGRLDEGYEASFIVLQGNPLLDLENLRRVCLVAKAGVLHSPGDTADSSSMNCPHVIP